MPLPQAADYLTILRTLQKHRVEFILVGGLSASLQGASLVTLDVDIVQRRGSENLQRLVAALEELGAHYRGQGSRILRPKASFLESTGHHLFTTPVGDIDVLGTVGVDEGYEELLPHTVQLTVGPSLKVRAINLETIYRLKAAAGRDKDRAVLEIIRQAILETQKLQAKRKPGRKRRKK